ncbi:MAG: hypothetical protein LBL37_02060 [Gracilibacteraceae bacterium]|jgi:hypothetical protein|nr:hypothetical protein [Gracilibacteraceae bacterium]
MDKLVVQLIMMAVVAAFFISANRKTRKQIAQNMTDPEKAAEAEQRLREYVGTPGRAAQTPTGRAPVRPAHTRTYTRTSPQPQNHPPAPREDGLWLPEAAEPDGREAAYPPPHQHHYTQQIRNPLGDALPDRVNESVRGLEGVWGDEGHSEHYRSNWLAETAKEGSPPPSSVILEISPSEVMRGVVWGIVLAEPPGHRRLGLPGRRRR